MVLTAGLGTRLRPLTLQRAKPALRLVDRSVVNHLLHRLRAQGLQEAVLNLHHLPETVRRTVDQGGPPDLAVHWSEEAPEVLGTGGGLRHAARYFEEEELFLLANGDSYIDFDLEPLLAAQRAHAPVATLALMEMPEGENYAGVQIDAEGRVRRIAGRPEEIGADEEELTTLHYPGLQVLTPAVLEALPARGPSDLFRDGLVPLLARGAEIRGVRVPGPGGGHWHDIGTPRRYLAACRDLIGRRGGPWLAHTAFVAADASVDETCALGEGARVEEGATVEGSVLLDGAVVGAGARVVDSLLGYGTWLGPGEELRSGVRVEVEGRIHQRSLEDD